MAIEMRGNREYVYLARREGDRVVKEYFGRVESLSAVMAIALARQGSHWRELQKQRRHELRQAAQELDELYSEAVAVVDETLRRTGHSEARRHWRLRGSAGRPPRRGERLRELHEDALIAANGDSLDMASGSIRRIAELTRGKDQAAACTADQIDDEINSVAGPAAVPAEWLLATVIVLASQLREHTQSVVVHRRLEHLESAAEGKLRLLRRLLSRRVRCSRNAGCLDDPRPPPLREVIALSSRQFST